MALKKQFTFKSEDGITFQGKLPADPREQLKMSQALFMEQDPSISAVEMLDVKNSLDDKIIPLCNIVKGEDEVLLQWGKPNNGKLEMKHLAQLTALYRKELIIPLVG